MSDSQEFAEAGVVRLNPSRMWDGTPEGYSQISIARNGALAVLSGQVGLWDRNIPIATGLGEQADRIARNLSIALEELNATAADIVMLRVYVVEGTTERFTEVWTALHASLLGDEMPSCSMVGVASLFQPEIQVEVEAIISVP